MVGTLQRRQEGRFKKLLRLLWKQRTLQMMAIPGVIYFIIFNYLPMPGIIIAFKNFRPFHTIWSAPWAHNNGMQHFIRFFSGDFWMVMRNSLVMSISSLVVSFPLPILLAICLNELRSQKFKRVVQTITYFPHFISWIVIGGITLQILHQDGLVNQVMMNWGLIERPIIFLARPRMFIPIIIITGNWASVGFSSILFLAAIAGIDQEQYEAATIDGATRFQKARHITVPAMATIITLMLILAISNLLGNNFAQIMVLRNPLNRVRADVIEVYAFIQGMGVAGQIEQNFSFGTAVGLFNSVVSVILLLIANFVANKVNGQGLF